MSGHICKIASENLTPESSVVHDMHNATLDIPSFMKHVWDFCGYLIIEPPLVNGKRGRRRADERAPAAVNDRTRQGHALPYPLYSQSLASGHGDLISFSQSITSQPHRLIFASGNGLHLQILVMVQRLLEERRLQMLTDISNPLHFRWCFLAELILCWVVLVLGWTRLWEYGSY